MGEFLFWNEFDQSNNNIPLYIQALLQTLGADTEADQHQKALAHARQLQQLADAEVGSQGHAVYCIYSALLYAAYRQDQPWPAIADLLEQAVALLESLPDEAS